MQGALTLTSSRDLLIKLSFEIETVSKNLNNSYSTINAIRDAYHLREWIWHEYLETNLELFNKIVGKTIHEEAQWNAWINKIHPNFKLLREITNGSKHFKGENSNQIKRTASSQWDKAQWDKDKWDAEGYYVELKDSSSVNVFELVSDTQQFWIKFFKDYLSE